MSRLAIAVVLVFMLCSATVGRADDAPPAPELRCAVIGGMFETGFWNALSDKFTADTGIKVKLIAAGPKDHIEKAFKEHGQIDLITMHSSDTIINLVADGYALDPQPWMKNDLVLVGPPEDPAGIKGMTDAAAALAKIAAAKSPFVVHSSLGAQDVLREILDSNSIELDPANTTTLFADNQRNVLKIAGDKHAYTLVGRIPFLSGKLPNNGLVMMVRGDARLRRPYVVVVANPARVPDARTALARRFVDYVRSKNTQEWIAGFGKGKLDDQPLFFPIEQPPVPKADANHLVLNLLDPAKVYDGPALAKLPHEQRTVKDHAGQSATYSGVPLKALLADDGFTLDGMRGKTLSHFLTARGSDGYEVVIALPELDGKPADQQPIVADTRDGKPLDAKEGPLRLIIPADAKQYRCVHQLVEIDLHAP